MQKIIFILFFSILFSCNNNQNKYEKNLKHFKNLILDINNYFSDSTLNNLDISNYYTEDFIFYSYPAGHKKGIKTFKIIFCLKLKGIIFANKFFRL